MTNSFFSKPEDELTVEELKAFAKSLPKLPNLSGILNPKNWDSKFSPGRGEGRAAFAQSKRNLDAMLARDALKVKNRGNTGTFINNPQTKKPFASPWKKSELDRKSKLLAPNTNETTTTSNPWSIQSLQDKGVIQTNLSKEEIAKAEAQPTIFDEDTTSKVAKIPKESNIISRAREQAQGKGSVAKNKALLADMRAEQTSSAINDKGDPVPTKEIKTITQDQIDATKQSLSKYGSPEAMTLTPNKDGTLSLKFDTAKHEQITAAANQNKIANLPTKSFDGTKAGTAKGLDNVAMIASALEKVFTKKKKPSTAGMEGKGGDIGQVAVAAGIDPEQFYGMV